MSKGMLVYRSEWVKPCRHDAPGFLRRWVMRLRYGSIWRCEKCDKELRLGVDEDGFLEWVEKKR